MLFKRLLWFGEVWSKKVWCKDLLFILLVRIFPSSVKNTEGCKLPCEADMWFEQKSIVYERG